MYEATSRVTKAGMDRREVICPKCKAQNSVDVTICGFCGHSLAEAQPSTKRSNAYICPTCNKILESVHGDAKKGILCPSGHKVQEAPTLGFTGSLIGGVIGGAMVWLVTWYAPELHSSLTSLSGIFRVVFIGYATFKTGQGMLYLTKPGPTRRLAHQLLGVHLGALVGFGVTAGIFHS